MPKTKTDARPLSLLPPYAGFSDAQSEYIKRSCNAYLSVAEGGKRAGKNVVNLAAWANAIDTSPDKLHLAAGVSQASAMINIIDSDGFGLMHLFKGQCQMGNYDLRKALLIKDSYGRDKVVIVAGGGDARSASLIKGYSLGTVYITEVNECHKTFVMEAMDRTLASKQRQIFFDLNPKPPAHWFYSEFLDYQDKLKAEGKNPNYNYGHFTILDNLSITDKQLNDALSKYDKSSIWYQRDILGLRTSASGRIYTAYRYEDVAVTAEEIRDMKFRELAVGIDVGGTDATVATLTGLTVDGKVVHIDGMYHKQTIDTKMDEHLYTEMVAQWLKPWAKVFPKLGTVYVDSANKLFRTGLSNTLAKTPELRKFVVHAFDKADGINQRIELSEMLLAQGRYKIADHMKKWHEAYQMATWMDSEFEKGEWVRTDDGSYPVDCLDSAEYSFYPFKRYLE